MTTGETKLEFRGHENYLEVVVFAPVASYQSICELSGITLPLDRAKIPGQFIATGSRDKSIKLWDVATCYCIRTFLGHSEWVRSIATDESGKLLASGSNDQTIIIWNIDNVNPQMTLTDHTHVIECVIFAPNEAAKKTLAESDYYKTNSNALKPSNGSNSNIEERKDGEKEKGKISIGGASSAKYQNLNFVISCSRDKMIKIWCVNQGTCVASLVGHDNWVRCLAFHHSGKYLYSCSDDKSIRIWDLATGKCTKKITDAHTHFVTAVASNPKYLVIASSSVDTNVKIWECK